MAKKKIKTIFTTKLTKTQIILSNIFIIILFSGFGCFFFSTNSGTDLRMSAYQSFWLKTQNSYIHFILSLTPTPTIIPTPAPPTPMPTIKISNPRKVDALQVNHSIAQMGSPASLTPYKTITNAATVQKLYDAILALPPIPTGIRRWGGVEHPSVAHYDLKFIYKGNLVQHGVIIIESYGIPTTVNLDGSYTREFYDQKSFTTLVENTFGLTSIYPPQ